MALDTLITSIENHPVNTTSKHRAPLRL